MDSLRHFLDFLLALFQQLWILFWPIWIFLGFILLVQLSFKLYKTYRLSKSGIAELDKLEGQDFEKYLELLFRKLGYQVKRTPYRGDYGADLVIQKAGVQTVVQAKRYKRSVGVKAIQEAVTAKEYYQCSQAMVVTNSHYSQQARKLARANRVELWDRHDLVKKLLSVKKQAPGQAPFEPEPSPQSSPPAVCETCGKSVSAQVISYCLNHPEVFGGKVYCYDHQKLMRYQAGQ